MKHLKKFNESLIGKSDIESICNDYLAYLLDDYEIEVLEYGTANDRRIQIDFYRSVNGFYEKFNWYDVKDTLIPFIQILNDDYKLLIHFLYPVENKDRLNIKTLNQVVKDKLENYEMKNLFITIIL